MLTTYHDRTYFFLHDLVLVHSVVCVCVHMCTSSGHVCAFRPKAPPFRSRAVRYPQFPVFVFYAVQKLVMFKGTLMKTFCMHYYSELPLPENK